MTDKPLHDYDEERDEDESYLLYTDEELEEAGFTIGELDEMPQTVGDELPDPRDRPSNLTRRQYAIGELVDCFPARRLEVLLELVEIFGLDSPTSNRLNLCRAL
jgi:hypothetical protein